MSIGMRWVRELANGTRQRQGRGVYEVERSFMSFYNLRPGKHMYYNLHELHKLLYTLQHYLQG